MSKDCVTGYDTGGLVPKGIESGEGNFWGDATHRAVYVCSIVPLAL